MFEWQAQCLTVGQVLQGGNLVYSGKKLNLSLQSDSQCQSFSALDSFFFSPHQRWKNSGRRAADVEACIRDQKKSSLHSSICLCGQREDALPSGEEEMDRKVHAC